MGIFHAAASGVIGTASRDEPIRAGSAPVPVRWYHWEVAQAPSAGFSEAPLTVGPRCLQLGASKWRPPKVPCDAGGRGTGLQGVGEEGSSGRALLLGG